MTVVAVIPARYGATRLPGKPLAMIGDKPMVQHVFERASQAKKVDRVIVATEDERIAEVCQRFGAEVRLTRADHLTGSDRVWEVAKSFPPDTWIMNVQGDEPFVNPDHLDEAVSCMQATPQADVVTLANPLYPLTNPLHQTWWQDHNTVKLVMNPEGRVFYFSRAPIPGFREEASLQKFFQETGTPQTVVYRHMGLYLYRYHALERFTQLEPSPLEKVETLEQLRALEAGTVFYAVAVASDPLAISVDTPEDLAKLVQERPTS